MKIVPEILTSVADLVEIAGKLPPSNVVVPGGHRLEDLKLVEAARDHGIVDRIILVGDRPAIERSIAELGISIRPDHVVAAPDGPSAAAATAELVAAGRADIVLKGDISTPVINRALKPLAVRPTVSLATVFDAAPISGGRPMVLTDAGFTTVCNFGRMVDLIHNACDVARLVMGIPRPRVAILSANEKPIPSLPSTWLGEKLTERSWENAVVYGPLSLDLATDPESVALKGVSGSAAAREVAGRADILVCPGIDTANAIYKTITALNKFGLASLAGITVGFPFPYVILSRADTLETRLESIALCSVFVQRLRSSGGRRRPPETKPSGPAPRILVFQSRPGELAVGIFSRGKPLHLLREPLELAEAPGPDVRDRAVAKLAGRIEEIVRGWRIRRIDAIAAPAGSLQLPEGEPGSGLYRVASRKGEGVAVDRAILAAGQSSPGSARPENFGIPVAAALARNFRAPAYAADPTPADASGRGPLGGSAGFDYRWKAAAVRAAAELRRPRDEVNLVVACLGREIAVAALRGGRVIDGSVLDPGVGGAEEMVRRAGREIGSAYVAAGCDVEAIVLTGELTRDREIRRAIRKMVNRLAPVVVLEGSPELEVLADAAAATLTGRVRPIRYRPITRRVK
ncbi:MAG: phosphate acyltransferase [Candidatus Erginobacter occultus]|nr:phosphate acyltransferase [Candidatus Erginobacter occultus]